MLFYKIIILNILYAELTQMINNYNPKLTLFNSNANSKYFIPQVNFNSNDNFKYFIFYKNQ